MNLLALRNEVLNHGFDPVVYSSRVNNWLNDGQSQIARQVNYYMSEALELETTASGTTTFPLPDDFARERSVSYTDRAGELEAVYLRDLDRSNPTSSGLPRFYAIDGQTIHLFPTPDNTYVLRLRYWKMPMTLVNDTDTPSLPEDYHNLLWFYAVAEAFAADDDPSTAQYWTQRFNTGLSEFKADQKFPIGDQTIVQARSMWDSGQSLDYNSWSIS